MNQLGISPITHERLSVDLVDLPKGVHVKMVGNIDMQDPSRLLDPFFAKLHETAIQKALSEVEVDFRHLEFLNSSGIKALAKWIMLLSMSKPDQRYRVKMLHNRAVAWQATSLPTLTLLVPGTVTLA